MSAEHGVPPQDQAVTYAGLPRLRGQTRTRRALSGEQAMKNIALFTGTITLEGAETVSVTLKHKQVTHRSIDCKIELSLLHSIKKIKSGY